MQIQRNKILKRITGDDYDNNNNNNIFPFQAVKPKANTNSGLKKVADFLFAYLFIHRTST